ncbi:MAG: porin [Methylophilaceae bacterium]|nr:MAG: porin [Methylophilaceae bacterium]
MNTKLKQAVLAALTSTALFGYGANAMADTTSDLVNALVEKGVLTEEEAKPLLISRPYTKDDPALALAKKKVGGKVNIRGYLQVRNTTMLGGDEGINLWSDRSVGDDRSIGNDKNFLIRRARVILFGDIGERLYYYLQPDFASSAGGTGNIVQLRDAYGDVYLTKDKVHRVRVGQSKVPYGFENLQSSQNRLALDRNDALNSAVRDERDLGAFYYYTPLETQALFKEISQLGLKHSGNYGQFGIGAYNGQGANRGDQNDNYHIVARYTHPWKTDSGQIYEAGIQAYRGQYVVASRGDYTVNGTLRTARADVSQGINGFKDERVGVSFIMYPQPFGIQAEWNWGTTPGLDIASNTIREQSLNGGYVQAMYQINNFKFFDTNGTLIPFIKWQYFDGASKAETNAPQNHVNDWEIGAEWQIAPEVELVAYYHKMKRTNLVTGALNPNVEAKSNYETFDADALRVQLQYNF